VFKKILSLSLIALIAISSISACSATTEDQTTYWWILEGCALNWCSWGGYGNDTPWYYFNSYGYYPEYFLKDLPGESLEAKNTVMWALFFNGTVDFQINSTDLEDRSFNTIFYQWAPLQGNTYSVNGKEYTMIKVPWHWSSY